VEVGDQGKSIMIIGRDCVPFTVVKWPSEPMNFLTVALFLSVGLLLVATGRIVAVAVARRSVGVPAFAVCAVGTRPTHTNNATANERQFMILLLTIHHPLQKLETGFND
jgi:hypothetical protein